MTSTPPTAIRAVSLPTAPVAIFWIMAIEGLVIVATIFAVVLLRRQPQPQAV
jgi:hypothetical protein